MPIAKPAALVPEVSDERARAILQGPLKNVYRAFDFREEDDYDRLALSASGDLPEEIYLQNRRSFAIRRALGGDCYHRGRLRGHAVTAHDSASAQ